MPTKVHPNTSIPGQSNFTGFSLPDGAWLPPELIYLLPNISGSQLKVLVAVLYNYMQIGGGEPTSLTDIEHMTGLSRPTVIATLDHLLASQVLERQAEGRSFIYLPIVKFFNRSKTRSVKNFYHLQPDSEESGRELINNLSIKDSLSDSLNPESSKKIYLLQKLRACGVYLKTAQAIVNQHDEGAIEQQLKFYRYALSMNMAQGPGWLVLAIKENWPIPLGYEEHEEDRYGSCPECGGPKSRDGFYHNIGCANL